MKWLFFLLVLAGCGKVDQQQAPLPFVEATYPIEKVVPIYIDTTSHIEPIHTVKIEPQVNGQIIGLYYNEGDYVESGTLLVSIDPRIYAAEKTKAEGELIQAKAQLAYAKDTATRNMPLADMDYVSQDSYDKLVYNIEDLEGLVIAGMASVNEAAVKLSYTNIYAPISGVLGERRLDTGDILQVGENQTLVTINQISPIWARFGISEKLLFDIQKERRSHPLTVLVYHNDPSHIIDSGELVFIDNNVNENTGMITMKGTLPNKEYLLWPGQYVKVRLILREEKSLLIPIEALQQGPDSHFVFTLDQEGVVHKKNVKTYLKQEKDTMMMIVEGITKEDMVITKGQINICDGCKAKREI
jgi:RND family efflux transporter MFP subunit